jgi:hypothetical protein
MADRNDPKSQIKKSGFQNFLTSLFGWRRSRSEEKPLDFITVDVDSKEQLVQAIANRALKPGGKMSSKLEELFESWLADTGDSLQEVAQRRQRVDQLLYAKLNDPFILRAVQLYADEATQLDVQDRIIGIETPDLRMTKRMYELLNSWGITQQRIRATIEQLATFGDAFWSNKITDRGVERIVPLKQLQVTDRLEFNPVQALEMKKRMEGHFATLANKNTLIKSLLDELDDSEDFADMFDTKLFGYVIENDLVVPPWSINHFRVNPDASEFFPFGTSPILGTLAPFKLTSSTITLQSIARVLSFPITLYKVKTTENTDEARQFEVVDRVREEYDNIGVNPASGNSEVYSVNTKIWMPDGLMDVSVVKPDTDIGFTDDIAMYQDRTAVASGVPKAYLVQEWGGFGNSALSLTEQYKPFARATYTIQTAFLEGLSDLFRLHFAITGEYDFRVPFTLSLRFPAEEVSDEKNKSRADSMELASNVLDMIRTAIGAEEDEGLPPDIVRDILGKFSFLDPEDIVKWTRDAQRSSLGSAGGASIGGSSTAGEEFDLDDALGAEDDEDLDLGEEETVADVGEEVAEEAEEVEESHSSVRRRLREQRMRELSQRYRESSDSLYINALKNNHIQEFVRGKRHVLVSSHVPESQYDYLTKLSSKEYQGNKARLKEVTLAHMLQQVKEDNSTN